MSIPPLMMTKAPMVLMHFLMDWSDGEYDSIRFYYYCYYFQWLKTTKQCYHLPGRQTVAAAAAAVDGGDGDDCVVV